MTISANMDKSKYNTFIYLPLKESLRGTDFIDQVRYLDMISHTPTSYVVVSSSHDYDVLTGGIYDESKFTDQFT